jgi:hypothetical protein
MSHFTVLVIGGKDIDNQLAPFQENNMGDCPKEYLEFEVEHYKEDFKEEVYRILSEIKKNFKAKTITLKKDSIAEYSKLAKAKKYSEFLKKWGGYSSDSEGNLGYLSNPNSKWDWWVMGGRWSGMFKMKKGKKGVIGEPGVGNNTPIFDCDQAKKGDIDFKAMENDPGEIERLKKNWEEVISGKSFYKPEYYKIRYGDLDNYLCIERKFATHSVLKKGEWFENGTMGWFGTTGATSEEENKWTLEFNDRFIKDLPEDTMLTIVDCHI